MSTSWQYGDVSPARYPDLESKRKRRGAASSAHHGGGGEEKEGEQEEGNPNGSLFFFYTHRGNPSTNGASGIRRFCQDHVVVEQ